MGTISLNSLLNEMFIKKDYADEVKQDPGGCVA